MIIIREEYDFPQGERGKFYHANTTMHLPVYLDTEVLDYLSAKAEAKGVELNQGANDLLKKEFALIEEVK